MNELIEGKIVEMVFTLALSNTLINIRLIALGLKRYKKQNFPHGFHRKLCYKTAINNEKHISNSSL